MRPRISAFYVLAFTLAGLLVMGCDSTGTSSEDPSPDEEGAVSFSLVRTANSDVPSDADSAFVRVWRPEGSFNLVEFVNIPDPGQRTEVSLSVPADNGYRAGVLAAREGFSIRKQILAYGASSAFDVQAGDSVQASLDVQPAEVTLERPESLAPNQTDTITVTYAPNVPDIDHKVGLHQGSAPNFEAGNPDLGFEGGETDSTVFQRFEVTAPNVQSKDTTYVKVSVRPRDDGNWSTLNAEPTWSTYFPSQRGPSFEIPVVPESSGDGTVIITFLMGENGWEKTALF